MTEEQIQQVVDRVHALREVTRTTGMHTTRSQQTILRALPDDVLTEVALRLAQLVSPKLLQKLSREAVQQ
jgi:hypothetical protein